MSLSFGPESNNDLSQVSNQENALSKMISTIFQNILNTSDSKRIPSFRQIRPQLPPGTSFSEAEKEYAVVRSREFNRRFKEKQDQKILPEIRAKMAEEERERAERKLKYSGTKRDDEEVYPRSPMGDFTGGGSTGKKISRKPGPDGWSDDNLDSD